MLDNKDEKRIKELREKIDGLDVQLLKILDSRVEYASLIGEIKHKHNLTIYRPGREQEILDRLNNSKNFKHLKKEEISSIISEIIAICRSHELSSVISYLGPEASFCHQAATLRFGMQTTYKGFSSIGEVVKSVASQKVAYGVVPIENNSQGMVGETIDYLAIEDVIIVAEMVIPIHFCFASTSDKVEDVKKIYSKDVAFNQCTRFISEYMKGQYVDKIPVESTSQAAQLAKKNPKTAAICSQLAAKKYQLPIMFKNIENETGNHTRFYILAKEHNLEQTGNDKTTIITRLYNDTEAGGLFNFLKDFKDGGINITKLTSHPAKEGTDFRYWFFLEFEGHIHDENVKLVLDKNNNLIQILGSYPKVV